MVYHEVVRIRDTTPEEEFGADYFVETLQHLEEKILADDIEIDDPEYELIHSQEFTEKLWDILNIKTHRELISSLVVPPWSVLSYIGMVASRGNEMYDLRTYAGVIQYHKVLFTHE